MKGDLSTTEISERQRQVPEKTIESISSEGYASLSMRGLALAAHWDEGPSS